MKTDYKLLDTGNHKRLEQFGDIRIVRAAKQAFWRPTLPPMSEWQNVHAVYEGDKWQGGDLPDFSTRFDDVVFSLSLLETGQVGIFPPEQEENWEC